MSWLVLVLALSAEAPDACAGLGTRVLVESHMLHLCEIGRSAAAFGVRLGKNGLGKRRSGDGKTPLGTYPLGQPRASQRYGMFIPVGFPTPAQKRQGYSGGAVGVHGPDRRVRWLGRLVNTFDTTDGCVGLATDEDMNRITTWVRRVRPHTIEIR